MTRLLTYDVARKVDEDPMRMLPREASMAKLKATEVAKQVTLERMQMMGGYGYATEYGMERAVRSALVDADLRRHERDPARDHLQDLRALGRARASAAMSTGPTEQHGAEPRRETPGGGAGAFLRAQAREQARVCAIRPRGAAAAAAPRLPLVRRRLRARARLAALAADRGAARDPDRRRRPALARRPHLRGAARPAARLPSSATRSRPIAAPRRSRMRSRACPATRGGGCRSATSRCRH